MIPVFCIFVFQFLENMELMFNMKAREKGVYIVGACGFDSIPADIGVMFMRNKFKGIVISLYFITEFSVVIAITQ